MRKDEKALLKKIVLWTALTLVFLIVFFCYIHYRKHHHISRGKPLAKVNGSKIYESELNSRLSALAASYGSENLAFDDLDEDMLKALLTEVYANRKIYKIAKKRQNIRKDDNLKFLAKEYYSRLVREKFLNENLFNNIREEEIRQQYDDMISRLRGREERKISHILLKTEEEAQRVKNNILMRGNFEKMANRYSLDRETAENGGSLGYVLKEEIVIPEFAEIAFLLRKGELSRPIETESGWHLVRVDDIREVKLRPYEEVRGEILDRIRQDRFDLFVEKIVGEPKIEFLKNFREIIRNKFALSTNPEKNENVENTNDANMSNGENENDQNGNSYESLDDILADHIGKTEENSKIKGNDGGEINFRANQRNIYENGSENESIINRRKNEEKNDYLPLGKVLSKSLSEEKNNGLNTEKDDGKEKIRESGDEEENMKDGENTNSDEDIEEKKKLNKKWWKW